MSSSNYNKARELWKSFCNEVKYQHRFFPSHPILDEIDTIAKKNEMSIKPGSLYYRARIIDENAYAEHMVTKCFGENSTEEDHNWYRNKSNKFRGLTKEGSYVPPNPSLIRDGRSNPKFIRYLYMAESPTTAVFEVRPLLSNAVNVSGIKVKEQLKITNLAVDIDLDSKKEKSIQEWLLGFLQLEFSSPTNNPDDHIPSQIIAEYCRHIGFDGIRYSSSLHRGGFNLTIFNVSKCEAVFSTDLRLENIKISLRPAIGAENIDGQFEYIKDNVPLKLDKNSGLLVEV